MADLVDAQSFNATKREIVILRALKPFAESADLVQKRSPINPEMIDIILTKKKLRIPIGLKKWIRADTGEINTVAVQRAVGGSVKVSGLRDWRRPRPGA